MLQNFASQPMEISKRYNSVPVKDNCALLAPTPLFSGPRYPMVSFEFFRWRPLLPWQRIILEQKITTTRPSWKIIARCFHLRPYFRARAIRWCHLNSSPADPRCYGNEFWVSCKFLFWRPLFSWQPTVFIQRQNWLQAHKSVKRWNAAARLYIA